MNEAFDKKLIELWFKEYENKDTWFRAWSIEDLCAIENKNWYLV